MEPVSRGSLQKSMKQGRHSPSLNTEGAVGALQRACSRTGSAALTEEGRDVELHPIPPLCGFKLLWLDSMAQLE